MSVSDTVRPADAGERSRPGAHRVGTAMVVAWQHPERRLIEPVGLLEDDAGAGHRFRYFRRAADVDGFRPFLGFPDLRSTYVADRLFPLFAQRIVSDRRRGYPTLLDQLGLGPAASAWEQLGRSEGYRTGDSIRVFPVPEIGADGASTYRFLVHGTRHVTGGELPALVRGQRLQLVDEPENPVNEDAVLVCDISGVRLGYVPDLLLGYVRALQRGGPVRVAVENVNGPEAPIHLRLLVRTDGVAPSGYRPMTGPDWALFDDDGAVPAAPGR